MINKSGLLLLRPFILQLSKELSSLIDLDVDKIQSKLFLIRWAVFLDNSFVIHLFLLLIVKKSFEIAIFAATNDVLFFLFKK